MAEIKDYDSTSDLDEYYLAVDLDSNNSSYKLYKAEYDGLSSSLINDIKNNIEGDLNNIETLIDNKPRVYFRHHNINNVEGVLNITDGELILRRKSTPIFGGGVNHEKKEIYKVTLYIISKHNTNPSSTNNMTYHYMEYVISSDGVISLEHLSDDNKMYDVVSDSNDYNPPQRIIEGGVTDMETVFKSVKIGVKYDDDVSVEKYINTDIPSNGISIKNGVYDRVDIDLKFSLVVTNQAHGNNIINYKWGLRYTNNINNSIIPNYTSTDIYVRTEVEPIDI